MLNAKHPPLPLHSACLHFYAALSEEALARQLHDMSLAKIQAFQRTKTRFKQAASALPTPNKHDRENESLSADSDSDVDDTVSLDDSVSSVGGSHPCSVPSSPISKQFEGQLSPNPLKPLPLRICKIGQQSKHSFNEKRAFFESRMQASKPSLFLSSAHQNLALNKALPTPPPSKTGSCTISSPSSPVPSIQSPDTDNGVRSEAQERYDAQLLEFAEMLTRHIDFVEEAISKTQEAQASGRRRLFKERKIGTNQEDERLFDLKARITNLKNRGWSLKGDRFVPAKYQELCERALAEL